MTTTVDSAFIRSALELADLNAVRLALFHMTGDPEVEAMPPAAQMDEASKAHLIDKATAWLEVNYGPRTIEEPPEAELRHIMNLATAEQVGDLEYEARKDLAAFKPFPWLADWTDGQPDLPDGFMVTVVGSGFSGLAMGVQLQQLGIPYRILERRGEPGGTWSINRYPDVRVDTISVTYEFSFEKNFPWTEYFGRGQEVRDYLDYISRKYGTHEHTLYNHDVQQATFDEARNLWTLEVGTPDGVKTLESSVVVTAVGTFANPNFPKFEGLDSFEGQVVHPARWPDDLDVSDKRVAVVGNGSTGVQLVSPVAARAEQVFVYQRTPQWISPREKYGAAVEPEVRWLLDNFPGYWHWWHYMAIAGLFQTHRFLQMDEEWQAKGGHVNELSDGLRATLTEYIKVQTGGDQTLIDKLIPDYAPFSRRPVVDNGWYAALTRDNVELVTDGIARMTPKGIESPDGTVREIDLLITATGFEVVKYLWPAQWIGRGGVNIHDVWEADGPRAYLGMMVPDFPNLFMIYGPNSQPLSGGSALPIWYSVWSGYVGQCLVRMIESGKSTVEVKAEAFERYNTELDKEAATLLVMQPEGAPDKNYYVNSEHGRLQVNAPWYGPEFHRMCTQVDWDALDIT